MKLKKLLVLLLSSNLVCFPVAAEGGTFTLLDEGDPAPFSGALFDIQATAEIISFKKYMDDRASEDMRFYLEEMGEQYRLEMETSQLEIQSLTDENVLLLEQNEELRRAYEIKSRTSTLVFAGGLALGMAVTIGFTKLVLTAVSND
jgi:hypothetical protein